MIPRFLLLFWLGAVVFTASAQDAPPVIRPGLEYRFNTQDGKVYVVEGSADGQTWTQLTPPIFGDGTPASSFLPVDAESGNKRYPQYRAQEVDPSLYGPAPVEIDGRTLMLNDNGQQREVILFRKNDQGYQGVLKTDALHARSFTYRARRTAQDRITLDLTYTDGTKSATTLRFSNGVLGSYEMRDFDKDGIVQGVEAGGFGLHEHRLPGNADSSLPAVLEGTSLLFTEGGQPTRLEFASQEEVILHRTDGRQERRGFDYDLNSPARGTLRIALPSGGSYVYDLTLSGAAGGTFTKLFDPVPGQLPPPGNTPESGSFDVPPKPPAAPLNSNCPPSSLDGKSLYLSSSDPVTLYFSGDGTGTAVRERGGSVEVTPFSYDYSRTGSSSANLAITFPGADADKVDDYDLSFNPDCTGSYQNSSFENGEPTGITSGNFETGGGVAGRK